MLEFKGVTKTFNPGTVDAKTALDNLSFKVNKEDFITIIGANGAGKSTLFGAIAGDFTVDSGEIFLDGSDITLEPEYKRAKQIGRLFQDPMRGSAPGMTVEENLALAAGSGGWLSFLSKADKKRFRGRVALLNMGLEDRMSQPVGLLSGGQLEYIFTHTGDTQAFYETCDILSISRDAAFRYLQKKNAAETSGGSGMKKAYQNILKD